MKKFYYLLTGIAFILVTIIACENPAIEADELQILQQEELELSAKGTTKEKITICHYDEDIDESYQITISENGLKGHDGTNGPRHEGDNFDPLGVDEDEDGIGACADCDDNDASPEASLKKRWYKDYDGDGYGDPEQYIETCLVREGYVADNTDCDDTTATILGEYIFEWLAPNGYKHYVNIDYYNANDGSFSGTGYFIYVSHSSTWAVGDEPLTVYGTYDKILKTFTGTLDYDNNSSATFNGTVSGCGDLTGSNILIYPYIDSDGDGYSVEEGDCNDDDATVNPGAEEICGDGIDNNCNGEVDENSYSPEGTSYFYWTPDNGVTIYGLSMFTNSNFDGTSFSGTGQNLNNGRNISLEGTMTSQTEFTGIYTYDDGLNGEFNFNGTVSECNGIDSITGDFYGPVLSDSPILIAGPNPF